MDNRIARLHLLAEVISVDGIVTGDERALLEQHMESHELSDDEKAQVLKGAGRAEAIAALRERPTVEREEIVDQLVEAALADGKLTADETALVKKLAAALGL
jgi:uncharacterized tellurite resistance protein B-like protein